MKNEWKITALMSDLERNTRWIASADQKANIFLAFIGILLTIFVPFAIKCIYKQEVSNFIFIILGLGIICFSVGIAVWSLTPTLKNKRIYRGLIYFGDVRDSRCDHYKKEYNKLSREQYYKDLIEQVYTTAVIAYNKHTSFTTVVKTTIIGFALLLIGLIL